MRYKNKLYFVVLMKQTWWKLCERKYSIGQREKTDRTNVNWFNKIKCYCNEVVHGTVHGADNFLNLETNKCCPDSPKIS